MIFILTARIPDYERFLEDNVSRLSSDIKISIKEIDDKSFRYTLPSFTELEIVDFIKHYSKEKEVQEIIEKNRWSLFTDDDYRKFAFSLYEKTAGDPIRLRFLVFGKGLALDARLSYDDYLQGDDMKLKATFVCSLIGLANYPGPKRLFEKLQLADYAADLEQESIFEFSEGTYRTKHPSWDLELLSYLFNVRNRTILQAREQILKDAANLLFEFRNTDLSKSIISAAYDTARLKTEEGESVPIEVMESTIEIPKYLDNKSKYEIFTYYIALVYQDLKMYDEAIRSYDKAIEINPQDAGAWNNRGVALGKQGKYYEAIESFDKAIEIDPEDADTWNKRGDLLREQGKYDEAIEFLIKQ